MFAKVTLPLEGQFGTRISLSAMDGFKVGHGQDPVGATGCTVILCEEGAVAGIDARGGAPASRETELLRPINMIERIHSVVLSGGSAYGLASSGGVMKFLEENGIGFDTGYGVVPIVCGASLFDLMVGDPKCRPDEMMGYEACCRAGTQDALEGNVGAGTGATVGKFFGATQMMKGGLGIYAIQVGTIQCAAVVAVNALGDVVDMDTGKLLAGMLNENKTEIAGTQSAMMDRIEKRHEIYGNQNTTIGCILTNGKLTKAECNRLASIAHNGLAKTIRPVHTSGDGDTMFVMSTGHAQVNPDSLGVLVTEVTARAIMRAVMQAEPAYGLKAARDFLHQAHTL